MTDLQPPSTGAAGEPGALHAASGNAAGAPSEANRALDAGAAPAPGSGPAGPARRGARDLVLAGLVGGVVGALLGAGIIVGTDDDAPTSPTSLGIATSPITRSSRSIARAGDIARILAEDVPAVVAVVADGGPVRGGSAGTGFVISEDGVIATNFHVVSGAASIEARFSDGTALPARVLGTDTDSDLAVIHVDAAGLPTIELGDSDRVQVGDDVLAIGNALALEGGLSVTRGIVSGLDRIVPTRGGTPLVGAIQTDAAINPGNSGGPLVDWRGRVVGINTAIADPDGAQNVGFAIPISQARPVFEALRAGNRPAYLGVTVDTESDASGAAVRTVERAAPAERGGVQAGDVIVSLGGRPVTSWEHLRPAIREHEVGSTVDVIVERDGRRITLRVTLEEDPRAG